MNDARTSSSPLRLPAALALAGLAGLALVSADGPALDSAPSGPAAAPARLSLTGLWADGVVGTLAPGVRPYAPQYPLWTDGALKRRWVLLPEGATIDARAPSAWSFPAGTRFWKEFRYEHRVETRFMERAADGDWLYATYLWLEDGSDAVLAPEAGLRGAAATFAGTRHDVPSVLDCRACHDAHPSRVLGFGALQLASERDPLAPHASEPEPGSLGLDELLGRGLLTGDRGAILAAAGPIPGSPRERAVLGTLHANCGGCHNAAGPLASLGMELDWRPGAAAPALRTAVGHASRYQPSGAHDALRVAPGDPEHSVLFQRMSSRFGATQMPPLGTHAVDEDALALVRAWIQTDLTASAVVSDLTDLR